MIEYPIGNQISIKFWPRIQLMITIIKIIIVIKKKTFDND